MFFGCYQLCKGSGEDYQETKGVKIGEGAPTVEEKVNWIYQQFNNSEALSIENRSTKAMTHVAAERADRISYLVIKMCPRLVEVA